MSEFRTATRAFVIAFLATASMAALRHFIFIPIFDFDAPIMLSLLAVMLAASISGLKSGLFATALNAGLLGVFYSAEIGFQLLSLSSQLRLVIFVVIGGLTSCGLGALHASRQRLEDRQCELEQEVGRREKAEMALREREERIRLAVR